MLSLGPLAQSSAAPHPVVVVGLAGELAVGGRSPLKGGLVLLVLRVQVLDILLRVAAGPVQDADGLLRL